MNISFAISFDRHKRSLYIKLLSKYNVHNQMSFNADTGSIYYIRDGVLLCATRRQFKQLYPNVKITESLYEEF